MTVFFKSHSEAWQHLRFDITWRGTLFITETFISINLFRHLCELPLDRIMTDSLYTFMYFLSTFFIFYLYRFVQKAFPYFPCYQNRIFLNAKKKKNFFVFRYFLCSVFSEKWMSRKMFILTWRKSLWSGGSGQKYREISKRFLREIWR